MPDYGAEMDQALRAAVDLAKGMGTYHKALVAEGFTREEALMVVIAWQQNIVQGSRNHDEGGT